MTGVLEAAANIILFSGAEELPAVSSSSSSSSDSQQKPRVSKDHSVKIRDGISEISKVGI